MKKLLPFALVTVLSFQTFAQERDVMEEAKDEAVPQREPRRREGRVWPAFFAVCEFPANPDLVGLRLTIPFSTVQENVTGFDLGLWGRALYFQGLQINVLRNDVKDDLAGFQIGCYNSVGGGQFLGLQVGLWNEANSMCGAQIGLINIAGGTEGFQIGLINRSETMHGYQVGLINVIRDADLQFCPLINIGW